MRTRTKAGMVVTLGLLLSLGAGCGSDEQARPGTTTELHGDTLADATNAGETNVDAAELETLPDLYAEDLAPDQGDNDGLEGVAPEAPDEIADETSGEDMTAPDETAETTEVIETVAETTPGIPTSIADFEALLAAGDAPGLELFLAHYDMPICEAERCLIVTVAPNAQEVAYIGDLNDWAEGIPLAAVPFRSEVRWGLLSSFAGEVSQYKLLLDGEWQLDASNHYFRFGPYGPNSAIYAPSVGRLTKIPEVYSSELDNTRDLFVYLPAAYFAKPSVPLGVLYMQDGFNVFRNPLATFGSWDVDATGDQLFAAGLAEPVIVVGIDTSDRVNEYIPIPVNLRADGSGELVDAKLDAYRDFLCGTIKPLIDGRYRTRPERDHTAMAGSSLGGLSAFYIAWTRPDVFSRVGAFSSYWAGNHDQWPPHDYATVRDLIAANADDIAPADLRIYLDSGDSAPDGSTAYLYDNWAMTDRVRNALITAGWDNRPEWDTDADLATAPADLSVDTPAAEVPALPWAAEPPAGYTGWSDYLGLDHKLLSLVGHGHMHNEAAWRQRMAATLIFLFPGPTVSD